MTTRSTLLRAFRRAVRSESNLLPRVLTLALTLILAPGPLPAVARAATPESADADPAAQGMPAMRLFRDFDGLPQNTVHALAIDLPGRLWVGTQDGAAFYDGRRWTTVDLPQRHQTNHVRAILAAADGSLWFGTQAGGLARWQHDRWETFGVEPSGPAGLPGPRVNALAEIPGPDGRREIWAATHSGLARRSGEGWRTYGRADGLPHESVWVVLATRDGDSGAVTIWAGTEGGLACLRPGAERFSIEAGSPAGSVNSLLETTGADGRRSLWAGTYGQGVSRRSPDGHWRSVTVADGLPSDFATSLAPSLATGEPGVWVGTDGGGAAHLVDRVADATDVGGAAPVELVKVVEVVDTRRGLPSGAIYSVLETRAEQGASALWLGTRNGGLVRLTRGGWRRFAHGGDPLLPVNALLETVDGSGASVYWLGTDGGGLRRLDRAGWTRLDPARGDLPGDSVLSLLATHDPQLGEELWVGLRNGGLARRAAGRWRLFDRASGDLPNDLVHALLETTEDDGTRALWVGTRGGLVRRGGAGPRGPSHGGRFETVPLAGELPGGRVQALLATRSAAGRRVLWVGTAEGLGRLENGAWRSWSLREGLPNPVVQALHLSRGSDGHDRLWIGTDGGGVAILDLADESAPLLRVNRDHLPGLPNDVVYSILEDAQGRIYLLTNRGVARLTVAPGDKPTELRFTVRTFTHEDGLPLNQGNRGAGMVDRRGRVWVGTVGGAAMLDPAAEVPDRAAKPILLRGDVPETGRSLAAGDRLRHDEAHLIFDFALLSFFRESETRYRSQLVGLEPAPSAWTADSRREFTGLPKGEYQFRVWGRDYAGNVAGPHEVAFHVNPAPWQTPWAQLLALLAVTSLVVVLVRTRMQRQARRERDLTSKVEARTRQLTEANALLIELSYVDALTSIANRRRFDEVLELEWRRAVRSRAPLALVMIDVDCFKGFNDSHGHQAGDSCLRSVATALADGLVRAGDMVGRYGGEEFGVILPSTDLSGAALVAETLRARVEELGIENRGSTVRPVVTISCGIASFVPDAETDPRELLHRADLALYRAKQRGRNRLATEPESRLPERRPSRAGD